MVWIEKHPAAFKTYTNATFEWLSHSQSQTLDILFKVIRNPRNRRTVNVPSELTALSQALSQVLKNKSAVFMLKTILRFIHQNKWIHEKHAANIMHYGARWEALPPCHEEGNKANFTASHQHHIGDLPWIRWARKGVKASLSEPEKPNDPRFNLIL